MRKLLTPILLSLVIALTACNQGQKPATPTREMGIAEYEVLSAYISGKFADRKSEKPLEPFGEGIVKIVISNTTRSDNDDLLPDENAKPISWEKTAEYLRKNAPALEQPTIDAFRAVNAQQAIIRHSFHPSIDYDLLDSAEIDSSFQKNGGNWPAYYKQYPGSQGILTFSRVGFSADFRQALLYRSNRCGDLCGGGGYVVMEKRDGHWMIAREIEMKIS